MDGFELTQPRFKAYVLPNAPLEKLADGFGWAEGPVFFGDRNELLFSDLPNNRVMRWTDAGGLSVYREVRQMLPMEDVIYVADGAYVPYGSRTPEEIVERSATRDGG